MKITVAIMAHPSRRKHVEWMLTKLGNVPISWDDTGKVWENARTAWQMFHSDSTHHMVLQDDISMCADFMVAVEHCVSLRPEAPMSFHLPRPIVDRAVADGFNWIKVKHYVGAQAVIMPVWLVKEFLDWMSHDKQPHAWDDMNQRRFFNTTNKQVFVPVPLLVNHMGNSLLNNMHFRPKEYIGDNASAMRFPFREMKTVEEI
jgi:GR25 family glycosyltransferase involved in LPS biosynthesis